MTTNGSTSLRVSGARKAIAESLALEISIQCGKVIKVSEILNFILDKHLNPTVVDDFIEEWGKNNVIPSKPKGEKNEN
ncbi:hypothetical protein ACWIUA_11925 [Ursidibacter sp. B-7004-1]